MNQTSLLRIYQPRVEAYLQDIDPHAVPVLAGGPFTVRPLAQGEYNLNYLLENGGQQLVFRVNIGTQIGREDQIAYEFRALQLLSPSGVTPRPYYLDDSRSRLDRGISVMEYLPGRPLDYRRDLAGAARTLATIHQLRPATAAEVLIVEEEPLSLIFRECAGLLEHYFRSPLARAPIRSLLEKVLAWADKARHEERFFTEDPWNCIVNTEVNSGNFIVNDRSGTTHLIDWEMPRWGDPSTDLCHFCSPLTTRWKSDFSFTPPQEKAFLAEYAAQLPCPHLRRTLAERLRRKKPFVLLRGISWSAMAWIAYQGDYAGVRNQDTWDKLEEYLDLDTLRGLFLPLLRS
jgi:aminoglycoside phosphotransferase (APT) family kinase protein